VANQTSRALPGYHVNKTILPSTVFLRTTCPGYTPQVSQSRMVLWLRGGNNGAWDGAQRPEGLSATSAEWGSWNLSEYGVLQLKV
jgi:hypothetical protein